MSDRINDPETEESSAIDPPSGIGGGGNASLEALEGIDEFSELSRAIDPPSGTGGGGN
jgi:hypothetical protein